jgi:uncharacterized RDD family membrane protein YckC
MPAVNNQNLNLAAPRLLKLGASLLYELLTITAIIFVSTGLFIIIAGDAGHGIKRLLLQLFLLLVVGAYYVRCWIKTGQTLAMQAWKLRLVNEEHQLLTTQQALARYLLAALGMAFFGAGFLWAMVDKHHQFLHDRLLRCKVVAEAK